MKILKLIISNPEGRKVREILFKRKGLSIIYGKVNKPDDERETSNSIGKTLLLKFIDYIFGANESSEIVKPIIHNWNLEAMIEHDGETFQVRRVLGKSELFVNNEKYELGEYKQFFNIDRKLYGKQIFLSQKNHLISLRSEANQDDFTSLFKLLDLEDLTYKSSEYYEIQNKIKHLTNIQKKLIQFYEGINLTQIEQEIFLIEKSISEKEKELNLLDKKMVNMQVGKEKSDLMDEYAEKNYNLKSLQIEYQKLKIEHRRLSKSLDELKKVDISSEDLRELYKRAKIEIPELILKRFEEVERFQENVYLDRKKLTEEKLMEISNEKTFREKEIGELTNDIEKLADIISQNEIYQESIAIYKEKNMELQSLKYKQGELSKINSVIKQRKDEEDNLATKYSEVKEAHKKYENVREEYKNFIYEMVRSIYTKKVEAYFSINLKNRHKRNRPFTIDLNLTGDTGEGVGEVRKLLIDLLIYKFNRYIEVLIQDSSCFSGIDNRQISNLIKLGNRIATQTNKQYIVSINDYQLNKKDSKLMVLVKNSVRLELDESNKLLEFDF